MSNFFQSTNINAGKYYQNGVEIDLGAQGAQGSTGAQGAQGRSRSNSEGVYSEWDTLAKRTFV